MGVGLLLLPAGEGTQELHGSRVGQPLLGHGLGRSSMDQPGCVPELVTGTVVHRWRFLDGV